MRIAVTLFFIFCSLFLWAQVERPVKAPAQVRSVEPTQRNPTPTAPATTAPETASLPPADTIPPPKSDVETTINYVAKDSIVSSLDGKLIWLYGEAKITYGEIQLEADEILIDYGNSTLTANGRRDSLGRRIGFPVFKNGAEVYETKDIEYNFKTKRAKITEVVTKQGDGIIHGEHVYKNENNELLTRNNLYTTCNLEHPHFAIRSSRVKAIPKDKIVSGPFHMEFNGVPIHLMGLPFGMFPAERESKSGIIFPSYGEERRRGFNLRNGGYFFDINEYMKLAIVGDLYTRGGHAVRTNFNYNKRYAFTGAFNFSYSKTPTSYDVEDRSFKKDYSINWSHTPQTRGTGRFSASVSAATATFNTNNNLFGNNIEMGTSRLNNMTRTMNSNVSYSKTLKGTPFNFGLNFTHWQDLTTNEVKLTLPTITVNMNTIYPFQSKTSGKTGPLQNLNFRYTMASQNKVTNNLGRIPYDAKKDSIAAFTFDNFQTFWENGIRGMKHSLPISTSAKVFKYFTVSPSMNLDDVWYGERLLWDYNNEGALVKVDTLKEFNRVTTYSGAMSIATRIYGTVFFKKGKVKAIRHVLNPSASYSYRKDFSENPDYFQKFTDPETNKIIYKSRHENFTYGGATLGRNQSVNFSLGNTLEMKVKSEKDTVARKVSILNQLSIGSSYNFLADSFNLERFSLNANTNILNGKLSINSSASMDPYRYVDNKRVNEYAWKHGRLGTITAANINMSTNLNPKGQKSDVNSQQKIAGSAMPEADKQYYLNNPNSYVDFEIPWNLRLNYSLNYSFSPTLATEAIKQNLQFSGDLSLSEQWKIQFNSGLDIKAKKPTQTNIKILRDLHCWTLSLDWTPFGYYTQYTFRINVKSSVLQDLKMERRKSFFDNF